MIATIMTAIKMDVVVAVSGQIGCRAQGAMWLPAGRKEAIGGLNATNVQSLPPRPTLIATALLALATMND